MPCEEGHTLNTAAGLEIIYWATYAPLTVDTYGAVAPSLIGQYKRCMSHVRRDMGMKDGKVEVGETVELRRTMIPGRCSTLRKQHQLQPHHLRSCFFYAGLLYNIYSFYIGIGRQYFYRG